MHILRYVPIMDCGLIRFGKNFPCGVIYMSIGGYSELLRVKIHGYPIYYDCPLYQWYSESLQIVIYYELWWILHPSFKKFFRLYSVPVDLRLALFTIIFYVRLLIHAVVNILYNVR